MSIVGSERGNSVEVLEISNEAVLVVVVHMRYDAVLGGSLFSRLICHV